MTALQALSGCHEPIAGQANKSAATVGDITQFPGLHYVSLLHNDLRSANDFIQNFHYLQGDTDGFVYGGAALVRDAASIAPVPEPSSLTLWSLIAFAGCMFCRHRKPLYVFDDLICWRT